MPTYDYRCEANNRIYEVKHSMSAKAETWYQLCELGSLDPENIPPESKVTRLIGGSNVVKSNALKNPEPACGRPNGCGGQCSMM
jgi:hypothetical protein